MSRSSYDPSNDNFLIFVEVKFIIRRVYIRYYIVGFKVSDRARNHRHSNSWKVAYRENATLTSQRKRYMFERVLSLYSAMSSLN